ncbi:MAG: MoaD/ThiS family protein [Candidatus Bathyarchaeia archaeon]
MVTVKFVGALRHPAGRGEITIKSGDSCSVKALIHEIIKELPMLEQNLIDPQLADPRPNVLILVNGKEISVLEGLDTPVHDGDEVVFIPVVHGG